jgi:hypothetical protein
MPAERSRQGTRSRTAAQMAGPIIECQVPVLRLGDALTLLAEAVSRPAFHTADVVTPAASRRRSPLLATPRHSAPTGSPPSSPPTSSAPPVTGRLFHRFRTERGTSYGMNTTLTAPAPDLGRFTVTGAVNASATVQAVQDVWQILTDSAWQIVEGLGGYLTCRKDHSDWITIRELGLAARPACHARDTGTASRSFRSTSS